MKYINKEDHAQLQAMFNALIGFEKHEIELNQLVTFLESALIAIRFIEQEWLKECSEAVLNLELVNADIIVALEREEAPRLNENQANAMVGTAISNLKSLVRSKLEQARKVPNPEVKFIAQHIEDNWMMCPLCQEAWEELSNDAMLQCPKCNDRLHNPHYKSPQSNL